MIDAKGITEQFIQYLQSYYGNRGSSPITATQTANVMKIPIFQDGLGGGEIAPEPMPMGGGPQPDMAQQLNGMFPGPHDPMRMN